MTRDRYVQGRSIVIHVVHKRDKKCSDNQQAQQEFPMLPETKRAQSEDKENSNAVYPNVSNYFVVHQFLRQPFLLNIAMVNQALPHLAENVWR